MGGTIHVTRWVDNGDRDKAVMIARQAIFHHLSDAILTQDGVSRYRFVIRTEDVNDKDDTSDKPRKGVFIYLTYEEIE